MRGSDRDLWRSADWGAGVPALASEAPSAWRAAELVRACCTPANLAVLAVVSAGWLALLGWSGAGPDGWQARLCAGMAVQPASCGAVRLHKDESRIVPHTTGVSSAS